MKGSGDETAGTDPALHGLKPALQVICLGSGGGPSEENVTGFLVRAVGSEWAKGSLLAVDAGSHLAPIVRILERDFPTVSGDKGRAGSNGGNAALANGIILPDLSKPLAGASLSPSPSPSPSEGLERQLQSQPTTLSSGPFAGLNFPNASARANALHVLRSYISTYLITHPHLDHLSGFAINTAGFHATSRPKTLAALPSTVDAVKTHIFNDVIWPNLSDEDGGVGFVTFQRLKEGGDVMLGEGEGRGYIDVCDGLGVRAFKVSHGVCTKSPPSHHHRGSIAGLADAQPPYNGSVHGTVAEHAPPMGRSGSLTGHNQFSAPGTPRQTFYASQSSPHISAVDQSCVVDSTAFFLRDGDTQREVLIFGDVEPDSISLTPRNHLVWQEAARKIAHNLLGGVFIECSYDDSQADAVLFGHLKPYHLIAELTTLAGMVREARAAKHERGMKKRKRSGANGLETTARHAVNETDRKRSRSLAGRTASQNRRRSSVPDHSMPDLPPAPLSTSPSVDYHNPDHEPLSPKAVSFPSSSTEAAGGSGEPPPLSGVKVVIIHVKDTMKDGPHVSENILAQLREHEARLFDEGQGLGCEFLIAQSGESYWF